ncbi:formate dehydrogenase accessory sulfurtransferase FdhD [Marinomonas algicola]|uniref:formate dehydrogenase accessory sulfurtransferase FdhD n=1 Tax=Marinomonas algicola TaxID=2773454 RepID=UPI00174BC708|nr:formate dehydrogenase accessory sulfurtransferase FdhD [Marinomonas algicola]
MSFSFNSIQNVDYLFGNNASHIALTPLVEEVPVAITINGIAHAVMMTTPIHLDAFVIGFALSEGLIDDLAEVRDLTLQQTENDSAESTILSLSINLDLSPRKLNDFKRIKQARIGATGCGLCGVESIKYALPKLDTLPKSNNINKEDLLHLRELLFSTQRLGKVTGAIHAALLLSEHNQPIICMEDIGRHNALDKIIGYALMNNIDLHNHSVVMSSRCSTELIQKAVRAGLSRLIHLASPSTLAVTLAKRSNLTLIHLPKKDEPRIFSLSE